MSKKRTSDDASLGEETYEHPNSAVQQQESNSKRARHIPASDKTLEDIPTKILTLILAKAVAMEVIGMKLAKRVWNDKADLVINRLKDVSLRWSSILATDGFLTQVHAILDGAAEVTVSLEIVQQSWYDYSVFKVTTTKDEIFMIAQEDEPCQVKVYDHDDLIQCKWTITVTGQRSVDIEACNVSNCVYLLSINRESIIPSIARISRGVDQAFIGVPWIKDLKVSVSTMYVSPNGNLIVPHGQDPVNVSIYDPKGSMVSSVAVHGAGFADRVLQKSNGNLVLASMCGRYCERVLTEIAKDGKILRQFRSQYGADSSVNFADAHGRIVISQPKMGFKLLDSELNPLEFERRNLSLHVNLGTLHYDSESDELITASVVDFDSSFVTTFCFIED